MQIQIEQEIGLTFARGLRSMLRHDPDVMMVGEVRDLETADIAIRVALTGHLVLSTLHTNDAASGITRLLEMGLEPFLVASSVNAFIAQRLVRKICPHCRVENREISSEVKQKIKESFGLPSADGVKVFKGAGCEECNGSGYHGRTAIYEMLVINEEIRRLILSKTSASEIKLKACQMGMTTLRQDGWKKVLEGITTVHEIMEFAPEDDSRIRASRPLTYLSPVLTNQQKNSKPGLFQGPIEMPIVPKMITVRAGGVELRRYERAPMSLDINYQIAYLDSKTSSSASSYRNRSGIVSGSGKIENISASGILFYTQDFLRAGENLEITVPLPDEDIPLQCVARVVRVSPRLEPSGEIKSAQRNDVAITFIGINSADRSRIERLCAGKESNEKI